MALRKSPKYKTLAELKRAYDHAELSSEHTRLIIDNDCCFVIDDEDPEVELFRAGGPDELIFEALRLLQIPVDRC